LEYVQQPEIPQQHDDHQNQGNNDDLMADDQESVALHPSENSASSVNVIPQLEHNPMLQVVW
jgi:hypothetical protein